ncbi:hypothetical protein NOVOSPHI9U_80011 [Novosphingobium sp. 9U]|nr:hypothetical protein NOVOSPHI9U_80011 [Novosphingobium sp. 9U]
MFPAGPQHPPRPSPSARTNNAATGPQTPTGASGVEQPAVQIDKVEMDNKQLLPGWPNQPNMVTRGGAAR